MTMEDPSSRRSVPANRLSPPASRRGLYVAGVAGVLLLGTALAYGHFGRDHGALWQELTGGAGRKLTATLIIPPPATDSSRPAPVQPASVPPAGTAPPPATAPTHQAGPAAPVSPAPTTDTKPAPPPMVAEPALSVPAAPPTTTDAKPPQPATPSPVVGPTPPASALPAAAPTVADTKPPPASSPTPSAPVPPATVTDTKPASPPLPPVAADPAPSASVPPAPAPAATDARPAPPVTPPVVSAPPPPAPVPAPPPVAATPAPPDSSPAPAPPMKAGSAPPSTPAADPATPPQSAGSAGVQPPDPSGGKPSADTSPPPDTPADEKPSRPTVSPPVLIAANGLPAPPPEKPSVPARCPPLDPTVLTELGPLGRLPRVDASGCMPWLAYAAPFNYRETRPRVGVVVLGLGKDPQVTQRAIDGLPPRITLAFASDAPWLDRWIERARARGHEVLVMLPVQTTDKPLDSTLAPLRADIAPAENLRRLQAVLARAGTGYIGVIVPTTTPLNTAEPALRPLLKEIGDRGLLVLETFRTGRMIYQLSKELGLPYSADAGWIDRQNDAGDIVANLQALEEFTMKNRFALAVGMAQRETVERLIAWSKDIEARGLVLAPVTGLTECLDLCAERVRKAMGAR